MELRKVQSIIGDKSFCLVLPKALAQDIGINKGDYCRVTREGKRLVIERVEEES